jgi:hypothetical protein
MVQEVRDEDVAAPRASDIFQEGAETLTNLACNLLPVFVPAALIDAADVRGEDMCKSWSSYHLMEPRQLTPSAKELRRIAILKLCCIGHPMAW